jgi:hypothetical protein
MKRFRADPAPSDTRPSVGGFRDLLVLSHLRSAVLMVPAFLLPSCSDLGEPRWSEVDQDAFLRQRIVGSWKVPNPWAQTSYAAAWYRIDFHDDGTFVDTVYGRVHWNRPDDSVTLVHTGKYSIANQVVEFSNVSFSYWTQSGGPFGFTDSPMPQALRIENDLLTFDGARVLNAIDLSHTDPPGEGSEQHLSGSWRFVHWWWISSFDSLAPIYAGRREVVSTFAGDSSYFESWRYPDHPYWPEQVWEGSYRNRTSILHITIGGDTTDLRVRFVGSTMYWFYDGPGLTLRRMQ